jgi:predicted nucleic acid-binding protein
LNPLIFDSSALLSYFLGEGSATEVQKLLKKAVHEDAPLLLSPINLGEIYYIISRREGQEKAEDVVKMLEELFFEMPPVDRETALSAAELKAIHGLGYADCFAAALALREKGDLVTGDKDFKPLERELTIHWI